MYLHTCRRTLVTTSFKSTRQIDIQLEKKKHIKKNLLLARSTVVCIATAGNNKKKIKVIHCEIIITMKKNLCFLLLNN